MKKGEDWEREFLHKGNENLYKNSMKERFLPISSSSWFIFPCACLQILRIAQDDTGRMELRLVLKLFYTDHLLHFFHLLEVADDGVHVFYIMYIELDVTFE